MLKKISIVVAAFVILLVALVTSRPSTFGVERAGYVGAPPDAVYAQLTDFNRWSAWSPWEKLDPAMKRTVIGTPGTVGHGYAWVGNAKAGEGSMTISTLTPPERVVIRLDFVEPWKATNTVTFGVRPEGSGSRVTWTMKGSHSPITKAFTVFMDMDAMVGKDFEQGLANLKDVAERERLHAIAPPAPAGATP